MKMERARTNLLGELPRARQKRSHASRNVEAQREKVTGEMGIANGEEKVLCRIDGDRNTREQHEPPK